MKGTEEVVGETSRKTENVLATTSSVPPHSASDSRDLRGAFPQIRDALPRETLDAGGEVDGLDGDPAAIIDLG